MHFDFAILYFGINMNISLCLVLLLVVEQITSDSATYDGWCLNDGETSPSNRQTLSKSDEGTLEKCKEKCYTNQECTAFSYETPTPSDYYSCYVKKGGPYSSASGRPNTKCYVLGREQVNEYDQKKDNYCSNTGNGETYQTLEIAKRACDNLDKCIAIEDLDCDDNTYKICKTTSTFESSSMGSCVYVKLQGLSKVPNNEWIEDLNDMKQGISRLTGALNSLTEEIRADEANITELLKDMKNNEKIFQNKVLNEIGTIKNRTRTDKWAQSILCEDKRTWCRHADCSLETIKINCPRTCEECQIRK